MKMVDNYVNEVNGSMINKIESVDNVWNHFLLLNNFSN